MVLLPFETIMAGLSYQSVCSHDIKTILKKHEKVTEKSKFMMFSVLIPLCTTFTITWLIFDNQKYVRM